MVCGDLVEVNPHVGRVGSSRWPTSASFFLAYFLYMQCRDKTVFLSVYYMRTCSDTRYVL